MSLESPPYVEPAPTAPPPSPPGDRAFWRLDRELTGRLLRLAYPVVLAMLTQTAINLLDTIMVGRLPKQYSIAGQSAIGYSLIMMWAVGGFLSAMQVGTQAIVARRFGEASWLGSGRALANSLVLTVTSGLIAAICGYLFVADVFPFFNSDPDVLRVGIPYAEWRMLGVFSMVATVSYKAFFDGVGFTKAHMMAAIVMNVANVILNYVLIFGAGPIEPMYVEGAGIASAIASMLGFVVMFGFSLWPKFIKRYRYYRLGNVSRELIWEIVRLSVPSGLATVFVMSGFGLFLKIVGMLDQQAVVKSVEAAGFWAAEAVPWLTAAEGVPAVGDLGLHAIQARPPIYVAATKVIIDILSITFMTSIAFGTATATLVGQSLGAGRPDLAERYGWESVRIGGYVMGVVGLAAILFPDALFSLFSKDLEVIEAGRGALRMLGGCEALLAIALILAQALYGAGNTKYVMKVELVLHMTCLVPLAYLLGIVWDFGLIGIWLAAFIYAVLMCWAMVWKFKSGDWKHIEL